MANLFEAVSKVSRLLGQSVANFDANDAGTTKAYESKSTLGVIEPSSGPGKKLEEALARKGRMKPTKDFDPKTTYEEL